MQALGHFDFSLKMDTLLWNIMSPKSQKDIGYFYKITPFELVKNLRKNSDVMHLQLMKILLGICKKIKIKTILDFGGGSGYSSLVLSDVGFDVTYAEVNILSLKWMKYVTKELNYKLKIIDLNKDKIKKKRDLILAKDVFEHFKNPRRTIKELRKLCKIFYVFPGTCQGKEDWLPMHYEFDLDKATS